MAVQRYDVREAVRDGSAYAERYWSPVNSPVISPEGEILWIIHRVEDVTAFVHGGHLHHRGAESEYDILLRSGELDTANKALRSMNEELDAFSYSVSHDLRAPIRHILGFMQLLLRTARPKLDEKERHYLDNIRGSAEKAGRLIDDLLAFARMARAEIRTTAVDVGALAHDVIRSLSTDLDGRDVRWAVGELPEVRADQNLLRVVLENLLSNALKYTRERKSTDIEVGAFVGESGAAVFFVKDNGAGFDMRYVGKLFGIFQRLHRSDEFEGTGI
jgi:light-regulated signal transduction histidine kinase (bacteriophytochrome)